MWVGPACRSPERSPTRPATFDHRRVVTLEGLLEGRRDDVLGVAVHHVREPRFVVHPRPGLRELLVGHASQQERVTFGELVKLEPLLLLAAEPEGPARIL